MRKGLRIVMAVAMASVAGFLVASPAETATTADITITVTIESLSITISDGSLALGAVTLSSDTVTSEKQVVTNNGNVAETYTIQLTATDQLTVGETETAAGANTFVLQALFTGDGEAAPVSANFGADAGTADDVVKSSAAQTSSSTIYAWTGSTNGDGSSVPAAGVRDLYFKYSAPTSDSATGGAQEDLTVTVTATAA